MNAADEVDRALATVARVLRWIARAALVGVVIALAAGGVALAVAAGGGVVHGLAVAVAAVVLAVPAVAFALLSWRMRTAARHVPHLVDDVKAAVLQLGAAPRQLTAGVQRLQTARGVLGRLRAARATVGELRDLDPRQHAARDRLTGIYVSMSAALPAAAAAVGGLVLVLLAIPVLVVLALV